MEKSIDVSGRWFVKEKWIEHGSKRKGSLEYEVEVKQKGRNIEIIMQDEPTSPPSITGILDGNTFIMNGSYSYSEKDRRYMGKTTVNNFKVIFSDDGESASFSDTWQWKDIYNSSDVTTGASIGKWIRTGRREKEKSSEPKRKSSSKGLKIRQAEPKDLHNILQLVKSWAPRDWDKGKVKKYFLKFFKKEEFFNDQNLVGIYGNKIVSIIGDTPDSEVKDIYWLGWFYTHKDYKQMGFGTQMYEHLIEILMNRGARRIYSYTSSDKFYQAARDFYLRKGFIQEGALKNFYEKGEDRIIFGKSLEDTGHQKTRMAKYPKDPIELYNMAWKLAKQDPDFMEEYRWLINVAVKTDISKLEKKEFLDRYAWVIYVSGFKVSIIDEIWEPLKGAFYGFSQEKIQDDCIHRAMKLFRHERKARAVVETANILRQMNWGAFVEKYLSSLSRMERLPFIGPATRYHLARNLGMGYAKPDRHLLKIAEYCGFGNDVQGLCDHIAKKKRIWVGVVDLVFWFLGAEFGTYVVKDSKTAKITASMKALKVIASETRKGLEQASLHLPWTVISNDKVRVYPYKLQPVQSTKDIELCETFSTKLSRVPYDIQETFICLVKNLSLSWERKSTQNEYRFQVNGHPFIYIEIKSDYVDISIKIDRITFSDLKNKFEDIKEGKYLYKYKWVDDKGNAELIARYIIQNVKK